VNTQEYISSGIIESYVLGLASDEERSEFEQMCTQYSEIREARTAFELSLEKQAFEHAITPSAAVKKNILTSIGATGKIVSLDETVKTKSRPAFGWFKLAAAASVLLLIGSVYLNVVLSGKNRTLTESYSTTVAELDNLKKDIQVLQQNPHVKMAAMNGLPASPSSYSTVYWDTASHDVYLLINNMPKPASEKQYQLWALLDGKPIDMGIIDITDKPLQLYRLKKAQAAQAFAITLENKNRTDISKPEGDMYVLGKL
jgi:anti-sigma-K factor RskA